MIVSRLCDTMYHTDVILKSKHAFHRFWGKAEMCALQIIKIPSIYFTKMLLVKKFCLKFDIFGPRRFGCSKFTKYHVSVILHVLKILLLSRRCDTSYNHMFILYPNQQNILLDWMVCKTHYGALGR